MWEDIQNKKMQEMAEMQLVHTLSEDDTQLLRCWYEEQRRLFSNHQLKETAGVLIDLAALHIFFEKDPIAAKSALQRISGTIYDMEAKSRLEYRAHGCVCDDVEDIIYCLNCLGFPEIAHGIYSRGVYCKGQKSYLGQNKGGEDKSVKDIHDFIVRTTSYILRRLKK